MTFLRIVIPLLLLEHDLFRKPEPTFRDHALAYCWSKIFSESRCPARIKSGAGFFGSCSKRKGAAAVAPFLLCRPCRVSGRDDGDDLHRSRIDDHDLVADQEEL